MVNAISDFFGYDASVNLLPYDGEVYYYGLVINAEKAEHYHARLLKTIAWKNDEAVIYGKHIVTARKIAWIGDTGYAYRYSGTTRQATSWTRELLELKSPIEALTGTRFNSCLLNLYHHGQEGMGWHSDDEASLGKNTTIASLSLGAVRKFAFRHKRTKETIAMMLEPGSLLVMQGATQTHWQHSLPKSARITQSRINLTFRTIIQQESL